MDTSSDSGAGDLARGVCPTPSAPVRSFEPGAVCEPGGDWSYWLDETDIVYGPGIWPFYWAKPEVVHFKREIVRKHRRLLRLVPSTMYGECERPSLTTLILGPAGRSAFITFDVFICPAKGGGILERLDAIVSFPEFAWCWPREPSEVIRAQAERRREKLLAFLQEAIAERDRGVPVPLMAKDRWRALCAARRASPESLNA